MASQHHRCDADRHPTCDSRRKQLPGEPAELNGTEREARQSDCAALVQYGCIRQPANFTFGNVGRALPDARTPGTVNFDLSLMKNTRITERVNLQFRAEAFNFLNHVNLGAPNTTFTAGPDGRNSNASFGTINSARDARVMQLGMKVIF